MREKFSHTASEPLRSMTLTGFVLAERIQPPNWTLLSHAHESTMIGIALEGAFTESIGKRREECMPKTLQILPAGEQHSLKFTRTPVRCLTIEVAPQRLEGIRQFSSILDRPLHVREGLCAASVMRLYDEFRMRDNLIALTLEGLILEILGEPTRSQRPAASVAPPPWLREARDIIHTNVTDSLSLMRIAASVGVHPTYLARSFRKFYRCSVNQYVRRVRVDLAIRALIESDQTLAEIAAAAGFYDQSHFTRIFKLHLRMTPARFRAHFSKQSH